MQRSWFYHSTHEGGFVGMVAQLPPCRYADNTWYRVHIRQRPAENLTVSICQDDDDTLLTSHTFPHNLCVLGTRFRIGFSQWMGGADRTHSLGCAVDSIRVRRSADARPGFRRPETGSAPPPRPGGSRPAHRRHRRRAR